jgi:hypothetical protein
MGIIKKRLTFFTGYFKGMTPIEILTTEGRPPKKRSTIIFQTDDEQVLYLETRNAVIARIEKLGLQTNDMVKVGVVFIGSEKKGRRYNNIFLNHIDYAEILK